jgi:hypothetical protein
MESAVQGPDYRDASNPGAGLKREDCNAVCSLNETKPAQMQCNQPQTEKEGQKDSRSNWSIGTGGGLVEGSGSLDSSSRGSGNGAKGLPGYFLFGP